MSEVTAVQSLAHCVAATTWERLPPQIRAAAPTRVLDILGLCLAARDLDTSQAVIGHVAAVGGAGQSTAVGLGGRRVPAAQAALVNGVLAHSLDYDDTHLPSILHPSASVVPAAMAAAELGGASGAELLTAITVGIEVCVRLGMAAYDRRARQSQFFERGQHATSICGTLASAAAAARLLGLDAEGIAHAMGIAASMGSGVIEANRTGGTVKRMHCGWAAHAGLVAADLAARGVTGPPTVLEGRFGFYAAWTGGAADPGALTRDLGSAWALAALHDKPYPANHFTHAVVDAALLLRAAGVRAADIATVDIAVATPVVRTIGEPIEAKRRPESGYHAKFSAPSVFAAAVLGGDGLGVGHADFTDESVRRPERRALADRVTVRADAECDELYPECLPAIVSVHLLDGSTVTERVTDNRGGPARPLSERELNAKFTANAARAVDAQTASRLAAAVSRLAEAPRASSFLDILREI